MKNFNVDLDEGRFVELGCIACKLDGVATVGMAHPVKMYVAALYSECCGEELAAWDLQSGRAA